MDQADFIERNSARRIRADEALAWTMNGDERIRASVLRIAAQAKVDKVRAAAENLRAEAAREVSAPVRKAADLVDKLLGHALGTVAGPEQDQALERARALVQQHNLTVRVVRDSAAFDGNYTDWRRRQT